MGECKGAGLQGMGAGCVQRRLAGWLREWWQEQRAPEAGTIVQRKEQAAPRQKFTYKM